jgi:hypothetical protein
MQNTSNANVQQPETRCHIPEDKQSEHDLQIDFSTAYQALISGLVKTLGKSDARNYKKKEKNHASARL